MIVFPQDSMRSDLERLWRTCFGDSTEYIRYFFENRYVPENCLVYVDETVRRPVAMLHLLPVSISEDGGLVPSQYIYAACTRPDYRRQGIMRELIETAQKLGQVRKLKYSVTVPAEPRLFRYYGRYGFEKCYKNRVVYLDRSDLAFLSRGAMKVPDSVRETMMKLSEVYAFRRDMLVDRDGFAIWDSNALRYAVSSHEHAGGHIITLSYGGDFGYAFCSLEEGTVFITELIVKEHFAPTLLSRILKSYPRAGKFVFRLPVYDAFFEKFGEIVDFAVICRNDGKNPVSLTTLDGIRTPYFGLALD
ncbi:MAG: GNAT family N-acetyltransferase [Clostridia bacterium]|nr:GNAT family N-acetyltransferase [Clostridia bacterium]